MHADRIASMLIKVGIAVMGYDVVVALVAFAPLTPTWLGSMCTVTGVVLFTLTIFICKPSLNPFVSFKLIPWMLFGIPGWARAAWTATLLGMLVPMYFLVRNGSAMLGWELTLVAAAGFLFALSSTFVAWARLRELQRERGAALQ